MPTAPLCGRGFVADPPDRAPVPPPSYLSLDGAASLLGLTRRAVEGLRRRGSFVPARRLGRTLRFKVDDLLRWMDERREP